MNLSQDPAQNCVSHPGRKFKSQRYVTPSCVYCKNDCEDAAHHFMWYALYEDPSSRQYQKKEIGFSYEIDLFFLMDTVNHTTDYVSSFTGN